MRKIFFLIGLIFMVAGIINLWDVRAIISVIAGIISVAISGFTKISPDKSSYKIYFDPPYSHEHKDASSKK